MVSARAIRDSKRYAEDEEYREQRKACVHRYRLAHKDEMNRRRRERYRTDAEYREKILVRQRAYTPRRYGMSAEAYDALLVCQGGTCAICRRKSDRRLDTDHCHATRKVRSLLCMKCNTGLGLFNENIDLMLAAVAYLEASRCDIDELADAGATTAEIAGRSGRRLELALRAAFALRREQGRVVDQSRRGVGALPPP